MSNNDNSMQPIAKLNLKNGQPSSRYRSMDDIAEGGRVVKKMDPQMERRTIAQWSKEDLEDKYLRLMEDYQVLKGHARQQESKILSLATKLKKITDDVRRKESLPTNVLTLREDLEGYRLKAEMAESQNAILKGKVQLLQSQLQQETRRQSAYDGVPARINSGVSRRPSTASEARRRGNMRTLRPAGQPGAYTSLSQGQEAPSDPPQDLGPMQLTRVLEELHGDLREKDRTIQQLSSKLQQHEQGDPREKRTKVDENLEMISINKALAERKAQVEEMRARYLDLERRQRQLERSNCELLEEVERLQAGGGGGGASERGRESPGVLRRRVQELEAVLGDHRREVALLKDTNEKLTNSAFDAEREHEWREKEKRYRTQLAQLELTQKRDVGEKGSVLSRLGKERDHAEGLEKEVSKLQVQKYELEARLREKDEKLRLLSKQGYASPQDIEEAITLVQSKRGGSLLQSTPSLDFLEKVDKEGDKDLTRRCLDLEAGHADTIQELEKTRSLLQTQYKLTNNYKQEAERLAARLEELRRDYEDRLGTYARLLDIRAARIQRLEAQMRDVAYGTVASGRGASEAGDGVPEEAEAVLERGQNLLEVTVARAVLSPQAAALLPEEPFLFGTWDFYDFETQATGIVRGTAPSFDVRAEYLVSVDDLLLAYLHRGSFLFELHQAVGTEFETLASCRLSCRALLDRVGTSSGPEGGLRLALSARMAGVRPDLAGLPSAGVLEYSVRFRLPMDQVLRQYREKLKAEGYIMANEKSVIESELPAVGPTDHMNELIVRVLRCGGLRARQPGLQPSPYLCYKFYDYGEHVSPTIASSSGPEFQDLRRFPVQMDSHLHQYLKSQSLKIIVLDDQDQDSSSAQHFLGIAPVPLLALSTNGKVTGSFQLTDPAGQPNGTVDVEIEWMYGYLYSDSVLGPQQPDGSVSMLPGELEDLNNKTPVKDITIRPAPRIMDSKDSEVKESKTVVKEPKTVVKEPKTVVKEPKTVVKESKTVVKEPKSQTKEAKPMIKERKQKVPTEDLIEEQIKEQSVSPRKSILKNKGKASPTSEERMFDLSDTLNKPEIADLLTMTDSQEISREEPPMETVLQEPPITEDRVPPKKRPDGKRPIAGGTRTAAQGDEPQSGKGRPSAGARAGDTGDSNNNSSGGEGQARRGPVKVPRSGRTADADADVVAVGPGQRVGPRAALSPDEIVVEVTSVEFEADAEVLRDESVRLLFAAYRIPGIHSEETESPALAKPGPRVADKSLSFNFRKTFDVSFDKNYTVRQHIAVMLKDDSKKNIVFNLVREPGDQEDEDCEDIGEARVDVRALLASGKDLQDERIPIVSLRGASRELMGHMRVSVTMLGVLRAIEREMRAD